MALAKRGNRLFSVRLPCQPQANEWIGVGAPTSAEACFFRFDVLRELPKDSSQDFKTQEFEAILRPVGGRTD